LQERQLIDAATRTDLLGNRLALIAPKDSKVSLKLERGAQLLAALGAGGRLATGDPDSVPVGKYAKAALTDLDLWPAIAPRLVRADNVRVALMYVARGEAPLGIVYATDAHVEAQVRIVAIFPESSHAPIAYPVAATRRASKDAVAFLGYLRSAAARTIFTRAGFNLIEARQPAIPGAAPPRTRGLESKPSSPAPRQTSPAVAPAQSTPRA
jgi:molybdate transport system substrate-binding protein